MIYSVKFIDRNYNEVFYHGLTLNQVKDLVNNLKEDEFSLSITYGEFND